MPSITERAQDSAGAEQIDVPDRPSKRPRTDNTASDGSSALSVDISSGACHRCHARKVKCGGEFPTCAGCQRANVRCMVHDPSAPREYTREELQQLYEKAQRLEREIGEASRSLQQPANAESSQTERAPDDALARNHTHSTHREPVPQRQRGQTSHAPMENRFVGQDTAFGFFLSRLHPSRAKGPATAQPERPELRTPRMTYHAPHPLPPRDTALIAVRDYFQHHHPVQPVLSSESTYSTLDRRTLGASRQPAAKEAVDLFRLFMVLAIGSIRLHRSGSFEPHPFGYFTAALEVWTPSMSSFNTVEDIEHLLLIAQFGFFYDIGCSIWELGRLSMRTAVELGLHSISPTDSSPYAERSRTVFWMVYMLDRSSSHTLGRPFAIGDSSISTLLPDAVASHNASHNWRIGLSRLTSRVRCSVRRQRGMTAKELAPTSQHALHMASSEFSSTIALLRKFNNQLHEWRNSAPSQTEPTCCIESPQYFDLLYHEARLGLLRAAIDKLAVSAVSLPESLLRPTLSAACSIISTFEHLKHTNLLTCTRAEAHLIFVTSLVVLSLTHASEGFGADSSHHDQIDNDEDPWLDFLDDGFFHVTAQSTSEIIAVSGQLLSWLCEALPDFAVCARIFEETRRSLGLERLSDVQPERIVESSDANTQVHDSSVQTRSNALAGGGASWMAVTDNTMERAPAVPPMGPDQAAFDQSTLAMTHAAPDTDSFDLTTASFIEGFGMPAPGINALTWPLASFEGMAAIDACFSGYVWDTNVPWEGSPSATMDSV